MGGRRSAPRTAVPSLPQDGAPEASTASSDGKAPKAPSSQAGPDAIDTSSLVEHPVYFISTVLRDARATP